MGLTIDEQETVINYGRGTDKISVYTTDTLMMDFLYANLDPIKSCGVSTASSG